jgi:diaminopimelate decarboxylase
MSELFQYNAGLFQYDANGDLLFDGKKLRDQIPKDPQFESRSVYVYRKALILHRLELYQKALSSFKHHIHYAIKANANPEILKLLAENGAGADVVSGGELKIALKYFAAKQIIFSGTGKTKAELTLALEHKIQQINVESVPELERLADIAKKRNQSVRIGLRINPSVDAQTHPYISTGFKDNKFGIDEADLQSCYEILNANPLVKLNSLTCHIGSQLLDFSAFSEALKKLRALYQSALAKGFPLQALDIGGGVGIFYDQDAAQDEVNFQNYIQILKTELAGFEGEIMAEPGRFIVARAGLLLTEVQYVKKTPYKTFVICSSGMNHLIRPALYQAKHRVFPLQKRTGSMQVDVVGPVCESSDFLAKSIQITSVESGDWLAVADSGAYGFSMATPYNAFDFPLEIVL